MPRLRPLALSALIVLLGLASRAGAAPIVFDFEDGLQGWQLIGSATRVQTQALGGEWAIFGDGVIGGAIFREVDLTGIAFFSLERFVVDGNEDAPLSGILVPPNPGILYPFVSGAESGETNPSWAASPMTTASIRSTLTSGDLTYTWGVWGVGIRWAEFVGFIDNITFHPIPEPATLALLGLGLGGLAGLRRPRRER